MNEKDKMLKGLWYDANFDPTLLDERMKAKALCQEINQTSYLDLDKRQALISKLLNRPVNPNIEWLSPFTVDYGWNIEFGDDVFVNHFSYFMDGAKITIGNRVFIGPYVGFYTANHPLQAEPRNEGLERALPITVENDVWIGANVSILPGVTIGQGSVIAAGTVVNRDVPPNSIVRGVPGEVVGEIDQSLRPED